MLLINLSTWLNSLAGNMYTGAALLCRQRIVVYHIVLLMLGKLNKSSSTYGLQNGCIEYPRVCYEEKPSHSMNCTVTPQNQVRVYKDVIIR